jgi:hypothetical protein
MAAQTTTDNADAASPDACRMASPHAVPRWSAAGTDRAFRISARRSREHHGTARLHPVDGQPTRPDRPIWSPPTRRRGARMAGSALTRWPLGVSGLRGLEPAFGDSVVLARRVDRTRTSGQSALVAMSTILGKARRAGAAICGLTRGVSASFWRDVLYCDHSKSGWSSRQCGVGFYGSSTRPSRRLAPGRSVACSDCP